MKTLFRPFRSFVILCAVCLCASHHLSAQGLGSISGTVTDATGAAVPSATVTLTQTKTGITTTIPTHGDGLYVFPSVSPAGYKLDVTAPGFKKYEQAGITVLADQALTLNVSLDVGSEDVVVNVEANAAQVNTTTGTMSQVIGQQQVNELPLNGRNAAALTTLVAGVVIAPNAQADQGATKTFPVAVTITANGTRVGQTNYLLDGGNNVDEYTNVNAPFPMPDAVQEFSVQTSNYSAEYGQNAGGVVNIITHSGGNQYHGDVFEFLRNRYFNAANYFSYVNGVKTVDPLKRNQFGGTVGGPVAIPGLFHTKHSFFFFGYQKTINHTASTSATSETLPTHGATRGQLQLQHVRHSRQHSVQCGLHRQSRSRHPDAQRSAVLLLHLERRHVVHGALSPPAVLNSASLKLLKYLPAGDPTTGSFTYVKPSFTDLGEVTARFDQEIGTKDRFTAPLLL